MKKKTNVQQELYSIGEVSRICNVSKKALRFYDKINIISPDYICEENKYRYYNRETLLLVPVIRVFRAGIGVQAGRNEGIPGK